MNEFDDGYLDDYPEDDEEEIGLDDEVIVHDYDAFATHLLHCGSIDADLTMAGFSKEDPMKMELFDQAIQEAYDPSYDFDFITKTELDSIISEYITTSPFGEITTTSRNAMDCSVAIAKRIISTTFEKAAEAGLVEPVVTADGEFNYIAKDGIDL